MRIVGGAMALVFLTASCTTGVGAPPEVETTVVEAPDSSAMMLDLAAQPSVVQAFATIEASRTLNNERMVELNEIPAPPFGEEARAKAFADMLTGLGLQGVEIDEAGNVLARRAGRDGTRTIALAAHLDTVFPIETDVTVRREGDVFYAPGIGDNTRGLVVLLNLVEALEKHGIETDADILFVGTVGEEGLGDLSGVKHLFREGGPQIDSFIAVDGGQLARLVYDSVGSRRYRVTFEGPGGHSYSAFGRGHPHQALASAISRFTAAATPLTQGEPKATFSVGRIGGGTSINAIPFESWMEVDMRSLDPQRLGALDEAFLKSVNEALAEENARATKGSEITVDIDLVGDRPAGQGDRSVALLSHTMAAMELFGVAPEIEASSTDSNIPISLGIPAVTVSRGGVSKNSHALTESWEDIDAHKSIQMTLLLLLAEAGFDSGN